MKEKYITEKDVTWIVLEDGSIYSPERQVTITRTKNGKTSTYTKTQPKTKLSPWISKSGYYIVSTKIGDKRPKMFVHRLIAMAFVNGYKKELTVNHINGNKLDNSISNLEWITLEENTKHEWRTGLVNLRGENGLTNKLTQKQVIHIRKALRAGVSANCLSIIANVNPSTIYLIKENKRWVDIE